MRIRRLNIVRYGHFTGHEIDFGEGGGGADFHVIYGPNEAGKTTVRDAFLHFLFGIPVKTPYNFIHPYELLEIAAELEINGQLHQLRRVKKKNGLLDSHGAPLSPALLDGALAGLDEKSCRTMFSLDDDSLEQGGEDILRSEGDLGQLLFAASSGLSGIGSRLNQLKQNNMEFYKPRGRNNQLAEAKKELARLKAEIKKHELNAAQYESLVENEQLAKEQYERALASLEEKRSRAAEIERLLAALPLWQDLENISQELKATPDLPAPPSGWRHQARHLASSQARLESRLASLSSALQEAGEKLSTLEPDQAILDLATEIERLERGEMEARYRTAIDIGPRQAELDKIQAETARLLELLGQPGHPHPHDLLLDGGLREEIAALLEEYSGVTAMSEQAGLELETARGEYEAARQRLDEMAAPQSRHDFEQVELLLMAENRLEHCRALEQNLQGVENRIAAGLEKLSPWKGSMDELTGLSLPAPGLLDSLIRRQSELERQQIKITANIEQTRLALSETDAAIKALSQIGPQPFDDQNAARLRQRRNQAWQEHRAGLEGKAAIDRNKLLETAELFEAAMNDDDRIGEARLSHAAELARLRNLQLESRQKKGRLDELENQLAGNQAAFRQLNDRRAEIAASLALPEEMALEEIRTWLEKRKELAGLEAEAAGLRSQLARQQEIAARRHQQLLSALEKAGVAISPEETDPGQSELVREKARRQLTRWQAAEAAHEEASSALERSRENFERRQKQAKETRLKLESWQKRWQQAMKASWLGQEKKELPGPSRLGEVLARLDRLRLALEKAGDLEQRIMEMKNDRNAYIKEVERLADLAGDEQDSEDPLETARRLRMRLGKARETIKAISNIKNDCQKLRLDIEQASHELSEVRQQKERMTRHFGLDEKTATFDDLQETISLAARRAELARRAEEVKQNLDGLLAGIKLAGNDGKLAQLADDHARREEFRQELKSLHSLLRDEEKHVRDLHSGWIMAKNEIEACGGGSMAAILEEKHQSLLIDIEEQARRYLAIAGGIMLVERALLSYREKYRGRLLDQASEIFTQMTGGAFSRLFSQPDGEREILVGQKADGAAISAPQMSKGTRFQLYLSLRMAGYGEFARHNPPLPFFADDILETFDDERSLAALSLMEKMAAKGQIIYLTHHQHIAELARQAGEGKAHIHYLGREKALRRRPGLKKPAKAAS